MKKVFLLFGLFFSLGLFFLFNVSSTAAATAKCCCGFMYQCKTTQCGQEGNTSWTELSVQVQGNIVTNKQNYNAAKLDDVPATLYAIECEEACTKYSLESQSASVLDKIMVAPIINPTPDDKTCVELGKQAYKVDYKILVSCLFGNKTEAPDLSMYLVYRVGKEDKIAKEDIVEDVSQYDQALLGQIQKRSTAAKDLAAFYATYIPKQFKIIDYFTQEFSNYNPYLVTKDTLNKFCLDVYKGKAGSANVDSRGILMDPPIERSTMQIPTVSNVKLSLTSPAVNPNPVPNNVTSFAKDLEMFPGEKTVLVGGDVDAEIIVTPMYTLNGSLVELTLDTVTYTWTSSKKDVVTFTVENPTTNKVTLKSGNFGKSTITVTSSLGGSASFNVRVSGSGLKDNVLQVLEKCLRLANSEEVANKEEAAAKCTVIATKTPPPPYDEAVNICKSVAELAKKDVVSCEEKEGAEEESPEKDSALLQEIQGALDTFTAFGAVNSDQSLPDMIGGLIKMVFGVIGSLTLVIFVYAGVQFMLSHGESSKVQNAKKTMTYAAVGLVVIFGSYTIVNYIMSVF